MEVCSYTIEKLLCKSGHPQDFSLLSCGVHANVHLLRTNMVLVLALVSHETQSCSWFARSIKQSHLAKKF